MCYFPVYRYRSFSDRTFVRVGSIKGYAGPVGNRTYASLLREARRLFAVGEVDVILLGPSPIALHSHAVAASNAAEAAPGCP